MYLNTSMTEEEDEQLALLYKSRFVFNGCYLVFTAFYLFVLCRRGIHLNLKLLFMHLPLVYVVNSSGQAYIKLLFFWEEPLATVYHPSVVVSDSAAFGNFFNMDVLVVERIVATVFFASYEKFDSKFPKTGLLLILIQWSMSVATFYIAHIPGLYHFIVLPIGAVNTIVVLVVSILLPRVTKEIDQSLRPTYERNQPFSDIWSHTLTERYQSKENLKLYGLVNALLVVELVSTLLEMALHYLVRNTRPRTFEWFLYLQYLYSSVGIESVILMSIVLYGTTPKRAQRTRTAVISTYSPEAINRIYFETYRTAWA